MIDSRLNGSNAEASGGSGRWMQRGILAAACVVVVVVYVCAAHPGIPLSGRMGAADNYYNLLVRGFRAGQLNLTRGVPPALAQLPDPYNPSAYPSYAEEVGDMSYYKGKLYLYFGVTPAVLLFWPYAAMTGHYLLQRDAVEIFCLVGFLASVGLLWALWRRYFASVSVWVVAAGALALGLAASTPIFLEQCRVNEVPISCGYALTMLALAAIWTALHEAEQRCWWLAVASLAYGLAVGARPDLLFGAVVLLVPVVQAWRERGDVAARPRPRSRGKKRGPPMASAAAVVVPIALIGLGLMLYNAVRFDSPFEFGGRYQLGGVRLLTRQLFGLRYLWFNFQLYFLKPACWSGRFPFVHDVTLPPAPAGNIGVDKPFGALTNIPLVWLALGAPLAWRGRSVEARSTLCGFLAAVVLLFGIGSLTLGLFFYCAGRHEMEFLPALVLLAVIGILSAERTLAPTSAGQTGRRLWWIVARWGWSLLVALSVAFTLLASVVRCAEWHDGLGVMLKRQGNVKEAIDQYEQALRFNPDYVESQNNLGAALMGQGKVQEAISHLERASRLAPNSAIVHFNLGVVLFQQGRQQEAIGQYEQALRLTPDYAEAHNYLGAALMAQGKVEEAIGQYEQALRFNPDYAEAHYNLAVALTGQGKVQEAIGQYEQALRLNPDYVEAHYNLGIALMGQGKVEEAIGQYEQAVRVRPDYADAHNNLGVALIQVGRQAEAMEHWEQALRIKPDYVEAHNNLANTLIQMGKQAEAVEHWEQAVRINPNLAEAHYNLGLTLEKLGRMQEAIQHYEQAVRLQPDFVEAKNALARARAAQ
jgi:tetratricopeptide (TPR) repeat protein